MGERGRVSELRIGHGRQYGKGRSFYRFAHLLGRLLRCCLRSLSSLLVRGELCREIGNASLVQLNLFGQFVLRGGAGRMIQRPLVCQLPVLRKSQSRGIRVQSAAAADAALRATVTSWVVIVFREAVSCTWALGRE